MPATAFDTLHAKQALTEAGVSDAHADAIVVMTRNAVTEGVATKTDIAGLKTDMVQLNAKIDNAAAQLDAKIENTAAQLRSDFKADIDKLDAKIDNTAAQLDAKIDNTAAQLDAKIENTAAQLRSDVKADIAKLESNMLRLAIGIVVGVIVGNSALTVALIKLFL